MSRYPKIKRIPQKKEAKKENVLEVSQERLIDIIGSGCQVSVGQDPDDFLRGQALYLPEFIAGVEVEWEIAQFVSGNGVKYLYAIPLRKEE